MTDPMSFGQYISVVVVSGAFAIAGSSGLWAFASSRLNRRDTERDKRAQEERDKHDQTIRDISELRTMVVRLEAQIDAMGVEFPHPEWTRDPYTQEIIECNAACRRTFFLPVGIQEAIGQTFETAEFVPDAVKLITLADRDAMMHGAAVTICRPRPEMQELCFIEMVGETRGRKRQVIKGFAIPTSLLFSGEIGALIDRIQAEQDMRLKVSAAGRPAA